jgi:hypothetical protein
MLKDIAIELSTKKEILLDKFGVLLYITYENNKFCMTQYNDLLIYSKEDFLNKSKELKPNDIGIYQGDNNVEIAEKAVLDFLNIYNDSLLEDICIYF